MDSKKISLNSLKKALASLERAIQQPKNEFSRDSVIQRMEFTFELSWKTLQKILEADRPLEDSSVRNILRTSAQRGFIQNLENWFEIHSARNLTSHTYNEETAEEVYLTALKLPKEVRDLLLKIESK